MAGGPGILVLLVVAGPGIGGCGTPDPSWQPPDERGQRIVSLMPSTTAILMALGVEDRLVARTSADPELGGDREVPSVGDPLTPSSEVLVSVEPDLIVAWAEARRGPLKRAVPPAGRVVGLDIRSLADLERAVDTLGVIVGRPDRADSLVRSIRADLARARRVAGRPGTAARERPTVAWLVWPDPPTVAGAGSFVGEILRLAGGRNVMREGEGSWPRLGFEALVERDPDILVWPEGGGVPGPEAVSGPWPSLRAVREGRVLRIDADSLHVPGPHIGRAALRLARKLAPLMSEHPPSPRPRR